MNLLKKKSLPVIFVLGAALFAGGARAQATANNFVDGKGNPTVAAAMCNVHVYNIGLTNNPADTRTVFQQTNRVGQDSGQTYDYNAQRYADGDLSQNQLMERVVALKAQLYAQEMKRQYDFLDKTLKQLKLQMEKAVLNQQLAAARGESGGDGYGSGGYGAGSAGNTGSSASRTLAGVKDCDAVARTEFPKCWRDNLALARQNLQSRTNMAQVSVLLKQAASSVRNGMAYGNNVNNNKDCGKEIKDGKATSTDYCASTNTTTMNTCINELFGCIGSYEDSRSSSNNNVLGRLLGGQ